jgi:molybdopterin adenylyltransferase
MSTSQSRDHHRAAAAERGPIPIAIVTVSDTRTPETDVNGSYLRAGIEAAGHRVVTYRIVPDEPDEIDRLLEELASGEPRIVLFNGGTGISRRDTTYDVVIRKLDRPLPGFGELFRMLSWEEVGTAAMLSRATAGIYQERIVFCMPGSPAAVRLAWQKLILPELEHLAWEIGR